MNSVLAAKVVKDQKKIQKYSDMLVEMAKNELKETNMNAAQYSNFVNLITCLNIKSEEVQFELEDYLHNLKKDRFNHSFHHLRYDQRA